MNKQILKNLRKSRRRVKIRSIIKGSSKCPRLNVYRSNKNIYIQLIDDSIGKTIVSAHSFEIKDFKPAKDDKLGKKIRIAFELGKLIAEKAKKKKIHRVVFDRGSFLYHGRVKAIAEGARKGGLIF